MLDDIADLGPATLENLCAFIWHQLAPALPSLAAVRVWRESVGDSCTLRRAPGHPGRQPDSVHPARHMHCRPRCGNLAGMKAYRASLLYFAEPGSQPGQATFESDGLLVVGPDAAGRQVVQAIGSYQQLASRVDSMYPGLQVEHLPGRIIAPGFADMHIHYPQIDVIGSPAEGLLPWLENYTFPHEKRFSAPEYSAEAATFFIAELLRHGVTTALAFATSHPESVNAAGRSTAAQPAHDRRQGADGPECARWRAGRDPAKPDRYRGAD